MCPDGKCYPDYESCELLSGCSDFNSPLMCPSGFCVDSFEKCKLKTYKCAVTTETRCADGKCRRDCSEIFTNGCGSKRPFLCPSGKCV